MRSLEEVRALKYEGDVEITTRGNRRKVDLGVVLLKLGEELVEKRLTVEIDKGLTEGDVHFIDRTRMGPVTVVDGGVDDAAGGALVGGHEHVGRIEGVDIIGREGRALFPGADGQFIIFVNDRDFLQQCRNDVAARLAVGLADGKAKRGSPGNDF
eukprot:CAMPEP_0184357452 /NCGR_PEP_ID=MMETSP1089-20130417/108900_1 /TAXON_ID=38269 ORGANISM="Gloeochaete wittrockiana, Strain SAG46.84" /NCGR_SAMPLE_ID=MMETSP1089 /ASSEMBLY_ACC=CAM_ASM_000445 /LENGTH=154 /DNA_ID=CAMNT_0026695235 /DNA_START=114 /DNA_END=575 /DNA_ORIENTATION=+